MKKHDPKMWLKLCEICFGTTYLVKIDPETAADDTAFARAISKIYHDNDAPLHGFVKLARVSKDVGYVNWGAAGIFRPVMQNGSANMFAHVEVVGGVSPVFFMKGCSVRPR